MTTLETLQSDLALHSAQFEEPTTELVDLQQQLADLNDRLITLVDEKAALEATVQTLQDQAQCNGYPAAIDNLGSSQCNSDEHQQVQTSASAVSDLKARVSDLDAKVGMELDSRTLKVL